MKIKSLLSFLVLVVVMLCPVLLLAQGDPGPDPDTKVPFDGGLSLLIAAGIGYGAKKAYDKKKKDQAASVDDK